MSDMPYVPPRAMLHALARRWWLILLRGIAMVVLGGPLFMWPDITFQLVVLVFGSVVLLSGVAFIAGAIDAPDWDGLWMFGGIGLVEFAIGASLFQWPVTATVLLKLVAVWIIGVGVFHIITAIRLREDNYTDWWVIIVGVFATLSGLVMLVSTPTAQTSTGLVIGVYVTCSGLWWIVFALRLKGHRSWPPRDQVAGERT